MEVSVVFIFPDAAGQFTAAPPTCPGDTFTFRCTVVGEMSGSTIWRVGLGTSECTLAHTSTSSSSPCGPNSALTARPGTGFGTSGPSFTSTLSGTATSSLDGTLVECLGQVNNVDPEIRVNRSTLQILGVYIYKAQFCTCDSQLIFLMNCYVCRFYIMGTKI